MYDKKNIPNRFSFWIAVEVYERVCRNYEDQCMDTKVLFQRNLFLWSGNFNLNVEMNLLAL